ncbi:MAG: type I-MYXAN CRISPR-associated Cas8a1/Cmx1 [Nostoc sp. ZfuVER08]|nr:type I-MYXAN CRISPR-associated Cas8a1/Cmx1 [Nostoc sp. ZfuVER08]
MPRIASQITPKIHLTITQPTTTLLHRAGMAGLWMTLKQLEKLYPKLTERPGNLNWLLTPNSISVYWQGEDLVVLEWLLKQSFQISDEGLIQLTGLNSYAINLETLVAIHQGITGTFLQHNKFFKSAGDESKTLTLDGKEFKVGYKKAAGYAHQDFAKYLCDDNGQLLKTSIGITGWLYPGATVRHFAFQEETKFEESPELVLALLFAPVACWYFVLPVEYQYQKVSYALVIPEIISLDSYLEYQHKLSNFGYLNFYTTGIGDSGLRFLTYEKTLELIKLYQVKRCQVISFGTASWSKQQKTRTEVKLVELTDEIHQKYIICCNYFPKNRFIKYQDRKIFIYTSIARQVITDNLVKHLPWWTNLSVTVNNSDLFKQLTYDQEGLYKMINEMDWDVEAQKRFVKACHEALKITFAKIYDRTKEGEYAQIERKREQIRSELGRCKNANGFRAFIMDFWSRAGLISVLQDHWEELLPLTTGKIDWQVARDLTLLALASYKPVDKENK